MITSVDIERLRGVREGRLDGLGPLTILVGPNGGGKSAVLDALLVGGAKETGKAVAFAVARRSVVPCGGEWLIYKGGVEGGARIEIGTVGGVTLATSLAWTGDGRGGGAVAIVVSSSNSHKERHRVNLDAANRRTSDPSFVAADRLDLWLIDARSGAPHRPLDQIFTTAVKLGRRGAATALLRDLVPGFSHVEILTNADGTPIVHVVYEDRSVPVALAGDGVAALIRLSLELAARPGGVVLIEEPEVHQHPAALLRSARAIAETVKRGVQVVVSTHSLELIDALVGEECGLNLEDVALFMLRLSEGRLGSARIPGPRVAYARQELEDDLR